MLSFVSHRNGSPATAGDLEPLAFAGYASFTAAQARGGGIRGLDLHLERLRVASEELFDHALEDELGRSFLRAAVAAGPADVSLTATVYSPDGEFSPGDAGTAPEVLVRTGAPSTGPKGPLSVASVAHERDLPSIKHVGEVAKTCHLRRAVSQGYDDAVFVDRQGRLSEGTIWNLAFWDGTAVVWPMARMLAGTTMGIVRRQFERLGVPQRVEEVTLTDLSGLAGAVVMNSWTPGIAIHRIDDVSLPAAPHFIDMLRAAFAAEPLTRP